MKFFAVLLIVAGAVALIGGVQGCAPTTPGGPGNTIAFVAGAISAIAFWAFAALMIGVAEIRDTLRRMAPPATPPAPRLTAVPDQPVAATVPTRLELQDRHGAALAETVFTVMQQAAQRGAPMTEAEALDIARRVQSRPR